MWLCIKRIVFCTQTDTLSDTCDLYTEHLHCVTFINQETFHSKDVSKPEIKSCSISTLENNCVFSFSTDEVCAQTESAWKLTINLYFVQSEFPMRQYIFIISGELFCISDLGEYQRNDGTLMYHDLR